MLLPRCGRPRSCAHTKAMALHAWTSDAAVRFGGQVEQERGGWMCLWTTDGPDPPDIPYTDVRLVGVEIGGE